MFELDGVTMRFDAAVALEVDRLSLQGGEVVGLIGANGSGKTTLLRLLAGLIEPTAGSITRTAGNVAYVGQRQDQHNLMPMLTVGEVLKMGRYRERGLLGRLTSGDKRLISEAAERLEVAGLTGRAFGELSGGQRQRVLLAGALAGEAACLLLDEPVTGLDLPSQNIIMNIALDERERGRLVVVSTHDLGHASSFDRIIALANHVVVDGTPAEVLQDETLNTLFSRRPG